MKKPTSRAAARTYQGTPGNLTRLAKLLRQGELVAVPTETVYGLAANALDADACQKIFRAKGRPSNDPLIIHVHALSQIEALAETNAALRRIAKAFWPGPLTVILKKKTAVPDVVTSGQDSVAIRIPSHPLFRKLLALCDLPLAAPSANPFGYISPTTAEHVFDGLGQKIGHILDGGPSKIGLESTILDLRDPSRPKILRPGAIEASALKKILRTEIGHRSPSVKDEEAAPAPGMLLRHYSPRTPLILHHRLKLENVLIAGANEAFVLIKPWHSRSGKNTTRHSAASAGQGSGIMRENVFHLSGNGDLAACAKALFATLRQLDRGKWKRIHAEFAPGDTALAIAINDRLSRAAAKS